jgi:hypothetical protein
MIGEGSYGKVYIVKRNVDGKELVTKIPRQELAIHTVLQDAPSTSDPRPLRPSNDTKCCTLWFNKFGRGVISGLRSWGGRRRFY